MVKRAPGGPQSPRAGTPQVLRPLEGQEGQRALVLPTVERPAEQPQQQAEMALPTVTGKEGMSQSVKATHAWCGWSRVAISSPGDDILCRILFYLFLLMEHSN